MSSSGGMQALEVTASLLSWLSDQLLFGRGWALGLGLLPAAGPEGPPTGTGPFSRAQVWDLLCLVCGCRGVVGGTGANSECTGLVGGMGVAECGVRG